MDSEKHLKLAHVNDIPEGKSLIVKGPNGDDIALFKCEGQIYAIENACPHMGGPLGEGQVENCLVTCPWHGWQFNIRTGVCENMPGDDAHPVEIFILKEEIYLK